jgi:hypothetical protein
MVIDTSLASTGMAGGSASPQIADAALHARPDCSQARIRIIAMPRYCSMTAGVLARRPIFIRFI